MLMNIKYMSWILSLGALLLGLNRSYCQNVEDTYQNLRERWQENPVKFSGMLMAEGQFYQAFGIDNRAIPLMGRIGGNVQLDVMGISIPINLFLGSGGTVFNTTLPSFSFVGLSPVYKNLTLHIGTRTLEMGRYSFSNHSFDGLGIEYKANNWYAGGFYGRLRRSRPQDVLGIQRIDPVFKRMGAGVKVGFEKNRDKIAISIFQGWDDPNSLFFDRDTTLVLPAQNTIYSIETQKGIGKALLLKVNYSISGLTENILLDPLNSVGWFSSMGGFLNVNSSTRWNQAYDAGLQLNVKKGSIQLEYQRVDPGYRTLGALFFQNDLENISLGVKQRWWRNRIQFSGRGGVQRNNLIGSQTNSYHRLVASIMLGITPYEPLNLQIAYSSFNNVNIRAGIQDINAPLIVTELVLNNEDMSGTLSYIAHHSDRTIGSFQIGYQYSTGVMIENDIVQVDANTESQNFSFSYNFQWLPHKINFNLSMGRQILLFGLQSTKSQFIGGSVQQQFNADRMILGITLNTGWNTQITSQDNQLNGMTYQLGWSFQWKITNNFSLGHNTSYVQNSTKDGIDDNNNFKEWRSRIQIMYSF